jgi:HEAT repeat protein
VDQYRDDPLIARGALRLIGRVRCIPAHELRVGSLLLDRLPVVHDVGIFKEVKEAIVRLLRRSPDTLASYLDKIDGSDDDVFASETELLSMLQRIVEQRPVLVRIEPVARRLSSANANVRYLAAKVLGIAGNAEAVKPLIERTKFENHDDVADSIRASVRKLVLQ